VILLIRIRIGLNTSTQDSCITYVISLTQRKVPSTKHEVAHVQEEVGDKKYEQAWFFSQSTAPLMCYCC